MLVKRQSRVRFLLAFWLFVLSAIAFLDRTNISIAGLQISNEYGLGTTSACEHETVTVKVSFNAMQLPVNQEHHVIRWIGI